MASLGPDNPERMRTLVSWKEIASFLDRAERTVKRWERERGLPVHRVPGGERGGVFAYSSELQAWLLKEEARTATPPASKKPESLLTPSESAGLRPAAEANSQAFPRPSRRFGWLVPTGLVLGLAVAALLTLRLERPTTAATDEGNRATQASAARSRAEQFYLQGRYQWSLRTADSLARSVDAYTQAIVEDPSYAQAYAGLAESYDLLPEYGRIDRAEGFSRAKSAADRAIALDHNLAAGHRAKAFALFYGDWDAPASDAEFKRALALAPNEVETHHWYAGTLFSRQEAAQSLTQIDEAVRLSPTNPAIITDAAFLHASFNDHRRANTKILRDLAGTQPTLVKASRYLASIDLDDENYADYVVDMRRASDISHDPDEVALANAAAGGWKREGKKGLLEAIRDAEQAAFARGTESGYSLARDYLRMDQPQQALRYFHAAFDKNDFNLMTLSGCDCIRRLKNDAGYGSLLRQVRERMRLAPSAPLNLASREAQGTSFNSLAQRQ